MIIISAFTAVEDFTRNPGHGFHAIPHGTGSPTELSHPTTTEVGGAHPRDVDAPDGKYPSGGQRRRGAIAVAVPAARLPQGVPLPAARARPPPRAGRVRAADVAYVLHPAHPLQERPLVRGAREPVSARRQ
ncbi:jg21405 [Pararge aegeria aegeria]|uniref:Jg21405 protein n=1 Tax=Pararge aegeria aegeria TaxID=348720 RepID=A0A8S4QW94_9NEOP|nr:jg21405 [Pararge aegeria aegeria]